MPRPKSPEDAMRGFLLGEDPGMARMRRVLRRVPDGPHCKLCAAPFEGPGGAVLRHVGFARFPGNPAICNSCIKGLNKMGVYGAEIPASLLFAVPADVRSKVFVNVTEPLFPPSAGRFVGVAVVIDVPLGRVTEFQ